MADVGEGEYKYHPTQKVFEIPLIDFSMMTLVLMVWIGEHEADFYDKDRIAKRPKYLSRKLWKLINDTYWRAHQTSEKYKSREGLDLLRSVGWKIPKKWTKPKEEEES